MEDLTMNNNDKPVVQEVKKITALDVIYKILPFASILLLIGLWIRVSTLHPELFPSPAVTYERSVTLLEYPIMRVSFPAHIAASLQRVVIALVFAWTIGIAFGVLIGWNRKMDAFFGAIFSFIRPIPPIAWLPLITIALGTGEFPKVLIVFIGAVMPVVVNTHDGLKNVQKLYLEVGEVFNANKRQMLLEIAIPASYPQIFAGIRTSTSTAWMVVLAAEMLGANKGVGFLVVRGMEGNDLPLVLVAMITIGVIGALLAVITGFIERRLCPWDRKK